MRHNHSPPGLTSNILPLVSDIGTFHQSRPINHVSPVSLIYSCGIILSCAIFGDFFLPALSVSFYGCLLSLTLRARPNQMIVFMRQTSTKSS